jgi:serine/threonine-protein kinase
VNYASGLLLTDRYRLEELIAEGGMGQVWRALDETLQRPVAVKVLRPDAKGDESFIERFRIEAVNSAGLQHPNIVTVHDFGEGEHSAYLVMELIQGESLSSVISQRGALPPEEVTEILSRLRWPCRPRTTPGSSTATSSPPTSWSMPTATPG